MQPMQPHGNRGWDGRDDVSFEDSERFEEDSNVSLDESIDGSNQNWRGWSDCQSNCEAIQPGLSCVVYRYHNTSGRFSSASTRTVVPGDLNNPLGQHPMMTRGDNPSRTLLTLSEIAARICAEKWSFQQLEEMYAHVCITRAAKMALPPPTTTIPEKIFLSFIVHCFPQSTDEIRMYSTLANGSSEQYEFGKTMYEWGSVRDVSQTGFLLSGNVVQGTHPDMQTTSNFSEQESVHVTVKVDRCRIVECTCECSNRSSWCKHVVALCIYRITERSRIKFNETIADAINSMSDFDLRRLMQWHINEIPRKCIPGFQKLIDQIKDPNSMINNLHGAPDPTDGGHEPISRFDFPEIENKIRRLLIRYCIPSPSVHCDVNHLSTNQHPTQIEWYTMMKPMRSREPEGMWNLLQMIREMFVKGDDNAVALLRTITDECLSNNQVLLWWYITKLTQSGNWFQTTSFPSPIMQQVISQLNCAQICDEVVMLWKLVSINPKAGKVYRAHLATYLQDYHRTAVNRLKNMISMAPPMMNEVNPTTDATILSNHQTSAILQTIVNVDIRYPLSAQNMKFNLNSFPGFHPAIQMCHYLNDQDIRFGVPEDAIFYVSAPNLTVSYKMVPPQKEKLLKKKKKKKKLLRRRMEEEGRRMNEFQGVDGMWRVVEDVPDPIPGLNDSMESGQESDVQKAPHRVEASRKKKADSVEMDVNEVLAAAFTPLDALESRFLKVEAYGTHGYRADAVEHSLKVMEYLLDNLAEQCNDFQKIEEPDNNMPSTSKRSTSSRSSSSTVSDDITIADREEEVARANRFLSTLEKVLYIAKVLKDSEYLQRTVFDIAMRSLNTIKYPFYTKHHQIQCSYLETEFVAILDQLWQNVAMGSTQMETIRAKAIEIIDSGAGNNEELPPIALTKFLFLALYWTEPPRTAQNAAPSTAPPALQQNRRLLCSTDSDLALHVALHIIGCRPSISERYTLHWEAIRREKSELTSMLLVRYKDSQEKCALVIDQILDPRLHRMYQHHLSNAAFFLERCPVYQKRFNPGQRPVFPYREEQDEGAQVDPNPVAGYEAQIEAEVQRIGGIGAAVAPAQIRRERVSDEGVQSSSSSDASGESNHPSTSRSSDSIDSNPPTTSGTTKEARTPTNPSRKSNNQFNDHRRHKKRAVQILSFDSRNMVTDAHVYHMQELSKKILFEAGGTQNTVMWGNPIAGGTNRRLHLCAIAISVYALGMSNRISANWNMRTYSNIASWVASQVQEIGPQALELIREIWMAHFTPNEIAQMSERAAPVSDPDMKREAAKLALSVLSFAHALTDDEVINALSKCRADSRDMLISGLLAMDTPQFRQIGRSRALFCAMQHWHDIYCEDEARNQPPPGMVVNPYANMRLAPRIGPQQNPAQNQWNPQLRQQNIPQDVPQQVQVLPLPQAAFLYPQAYRHEVNRMHQSRSAPQLGGNPGLEDHHAVPMQAPNHEYMPQPSPNNALMNAYHYGMRAMDCMASSPGEERHMYLKFGKHPPYSEDLRCLYAIAKQLGGQYLLSFYTNASRSVLSPYILHQYAVESTQYFPPRMYNQNMVRMPGGLVSMAPSSLVPMLQQSPANVRYPNIKFTMPGQICSIFMAHGYPQITGELFERCCEQYLQAITNKMNSPRVNENEKFKFSEQLCSFIQGAHEALKWVPNVGRQLFDDFVRAFKRQKSYKKDCASTVNKLLAQLCG